MPANRILEVYYRGRLVGNLAETPDKRVAFQYSDEWIKTGFSISPISLPLGNNVFVPMESSRERFGGLFGVFADSLPDSWGELLLNRYLESIGIPSDRITTLDRLAYVGCSGMGALEYHPSKERDFDLNAYSPDFDVIAKECEKLLSSKTSDQLDILYRLGGSSGGTRPKILLSKDDREWIVKFPAKIDPSISGKREYDYSLCAKKCGITMTETALIDSSVCEGYFMTERFDRKNKEKIFTVTAAGLLEADFRAPSCDYETLLKLVRVLTKDNTIDKEQLFRTMCFNVKTHNHDDHAKNFSFTYTENLGWRLAQAYDLTYSDTYWGEHTTAVNGKGRDITNEDLIKVGTSADIPEKTGREYIEEITEKTKDLADYLNHKPRKRSQKTKVSDRVAELTGEKIRNKEGNNSRSTPWKH